MSTKASNQALIDAIADGEPNSAEEARLAWTALNNELYPTVNKTTLSAPIGTSVLSSFFNYDFIYSKSGNKVTMTGWLRTTQSRPANTALFSFTDTQFYSKNNGTNIVDQKFTIGEWDFKIADGTFYCVDALPNMGLSAETRFNITYFTND